MLEELYLIRRQLYIAGCLYLGQTIVGYTLGWTAPVIPKLQDETQTPLLNPITDQQASWVGSVLYIGTILGPYVSGFLSNIKGRKPCLFLGSFLCIIAFLVLALANNLAMIYAGRILVGLGVGIIFVINLVYIGEIASTHIRGVLLTCTGIFSTLGTLLIYSVGPYVSYSWTSYIGLALTLMYTVGIFFIPETPVFLALISALSEVPTNLYEYNQDGKEKQAKKTLTDLGRGDEYDSVISAKAELSLAERKKKDQWIEIVSVRSNQRALFITLTLCTLHQMSGIVAVVFFMTTIFQMAESSIEPNLATIIIGITQLLGSIVTPMFVERAGRRLLLVFSTLVCCLSLGILGTYFYLNHIDNELVKNYGWIPLATLIIFFLSNDFGFSIIPPTLVGEMYTSNVRSTGSTVTVTMSWLIGFAVSSAFGAMIAIGPHFAFWIYSGACAVAFVFTLIFVPETKGKTLLEVQEMLSERWIK